MYIFKAFIVKKVIYIPIPNMNNNIIKFIIGIIANIGLKPDELIFDTEPPIVFTPYPLYSRKSIDLPYSILLICNKYIYTYCFAWAYIHFLKKS